LRSLLPRSLVLLATLQLTAAAHAHTRSESYSHWHIAGTAITGTVTIPVREVMLLYEAADAAQPPRELFRDHLAANVTVRSASGDCPLTDSNILQIASGFIRVELHYECAPDTPQAIRFRAMFDAAPAHIHYARLHRDGVQLGEALLTNTSDRWDFGDLRAATGTSFLAFLGIGIEHIAGGIDHIAFLLGLLLIAGSVGRSIIAVTGFTLGHSISLAAAVLGYVSADSRLVEAFIGFTVALVAVEYFVLRRPDAGRFAVFCLALAWLTGLAAVLPETLPVKALYAYVGFGVFAACYLLLAARSEVQDLRRATLLLFVATCCFGLVHGFGFAGFLMQTGLLGTSLFVPLLGFNLGVEAGQLILIVVALVGGMLLKGRAPAALPQLAAGALCGIGLYWFVSRTIV